MNGQNGSISQLQQDQNGANNNQKSLEVSANYSNTIFASFGTQVPSAAVQHRKLMQGGILSS